MLDWYVASLRWYRGLILRCVECRHGVSNWISSSLSSRSLLLWGCLCMTLAGMVSPVGGTKCERSIVGTQVTCVRVYENGTYMYGGVPVCLSVVAVPTPRLVRILCALSYGFFMVMRLFNPYSWLVVWPWSVCRVAPGVMLHGRENRVVQCMSSWVIVGCCCYCD